MARAERLSGILLPVFSLRSKTDLGVGDFGAMSGLLSWMERAQQRMLMVLPLLPTAHHDPSPYATRSAFGLNPLFIDLSAVPEFKEGGELEQLSKDERGQAEEARASERVRYDRVFWLKGHLLRKAFDRFHQGPWKKDGAPARALKQYLEEQARWLKPFALFQAISRREDYRAFWEWPAPLRDRDAKALAEAEQQLSHEVLYQSWLQWVAESQWRKVREEAKRRNILLCGDEPFIIGSDSVDCWTFPELLRRDARLGVPPDAFSATGQDWGLPYFDFGAMARDDYAWLRYRAEKSASYFDLRRVDHAVGYFRQWIRDQQSPTGRFVPPDEATQRVLGERIFKLIGASAGVVAEDLGMVPQWVRETLTRLGVPGYRVLRWERDNERYRDPRQFPPMSLVTSGTHDTDTQREWWETASDAERWGLRNVSPPLQTLPGISPEYTPAVHEALLRTALQSGSNICLFPWQDVLGTRDRINLPGTMGDSNWSYRIAQNAEELLSRADTRQAAEQLASWTADAGR